MDLALKIYDHPDQVYDQHWRLTCFVYRDSKLAKNQFVMARAVVACCVADATPIGIIAETPDALNFKVDTWLEVEGVLQSVLLKVQMKYNRFLIYKLKKMVLHILLLKVGRWFRPPRTHIWSLQ